MPSIDLYKKLHTDVEGAYIKARGDTEGNLCTVPPADGTPKFNFLTLNGDGVTTNLNGNYSAAATKAWFEAPAKLDVYSFLVTISDNANFVQTGWGGGATLTNGISFSIYNKEYNVEFTIISQFVFKENCDWYYLSPESHLTNFAGLSQTMCMELDIRKRFGKPFNFAKGDRFIVNLHDDFTHLVAQSVSVGSHLFLEPYELFLPH